ncbi:MAG: anthrone oxygenase family protein [Pseudomonadota bacterium]
MSMLEIFLVLATLFCALIAGFVFAFATVVMPGIAKLDDRGFIRAFQVIDGVIQAGQPVFGLVWIGSAVALLLAGVMGGLQLDGPERAVLLSAVTAYVFGVQIPTFKINVPMNNALQALDVEVMDDAALASARAEFEEPWARWNAIRTAVASLVSVALMVILLSL